MMNLEKKVRRSSHRCVHVADFFADCASSLPCMGIGRMSNLSIGATIASRSGDGVGSLGVGRVASARPPRRYGRLNPQKIHIYTLCARLHVSCGARR